MAGRIYPLVLAAMVLTVLSAVSVALEVLLIILEGLQVESAPVFFFVIISEFVIFSLVSSAFASGAIIFWRRVALALRGE